MKSGVMAALVGIAGICGLQESLAQPGSWAAFNGYTAGMTKAAAKARGYGACAHGANGGLSDSVFCEIPPDRRRLGSLEATSATLEFKAADLNRVHQIRVTFPANALDVMKALEVQYGKPAGAVNHGVRWQRQTAEFITIGTKFPSQSKAVVLFDFDPGLPARLKAHEAAELKKKKQLSTF